MQLRNWKEEMSALAHDLLHLETNTIIADGMTGRKMPSYPHALLDIAHSYLNYMQREFRVDLVDFWQLAEGETDEEEKRRRLKHPDDKHKPLFSKQPRTLWTQDVKNDEDTFIRLHYAAAYVLNHIQEAGSLGVAVTQKNRPVLVRIKRNCDAVLALIEAFDQLEQEIGRKFLGTSRRELLKKKDPPVQPPTELNIQLRKIWDIGTDEIVLQTVLQLDGDVVNRIKRDFDYQTNAPLLRAHQEITDLGIKNWQSMFALALKLVSNAFKVLFEPGTGR